MTRGDQRAIRCVVTNRIDTVLGRASAKNLGRAQRVSSPAARSADANDVSSEVRALVDAADGNIAWRESRRGFPLPAPTPLDREGRRISAKCSRQDAPSHPVAS
ncbi:Hypothetical protein BN69_3636 [Methylocystis sp. SC2]|nr:Hypothetical protein BN69_3636 [Methylocystis sp. SC2]